MRLLRALLAAASLSLSAACGGGTPTEPPAAVEGEASLSGTGFLGGGTR